MTFGLDAISGLHDQKRIDGDKILAVLEKATPEIEARLEQSATRRYREDFAAAKSIEQISAFITRYGVTQSGGSRYESGRNISKPLAILLWLHRSGKVTDKDLADALK